MPYLTGFIGETLEMVHSHSLGDLYSLEDDAVEDVEMKEEKKKSGIRCRVQFGQTFDREYLASSPCTSTVCGYLIEICIFMVSQYRQQSGSIDPILHALRQMNKYLVELVLE